MVLLISAFKLSSRIFFSMIVRRRPGLVASTILVQLGFEVPHLVYREVVEKAVGARIDDQNLFGERQWRKLLLLEDFDQTLPAIELVLRGFVEIAAELGEGREFADIARDRASCFPLPGAWP